MRKLGKNQIDALAESLRKRVEEIGRVEFLVRADQGNLRLPGLNVGNLFIPGGEKMSFGQWWDYATEGFAPKVAAATGLKQERDINFMLQTQNSRFFTARAINRYRGESEVPFSEMVGKVREGDKEKAAWLKDQINASGLGDNKIFQSFIKNLTSQTEMADPTSRMSAVADAVSYSGMLKYAKRSADDPRNLKKWQEFLRSYEIAMRVVSWRDPSTESVEDKYQKTKRWADDEVIDASGAPSVGDNSEADRAASTIATAIIGTSSGLQKTTNEISDKTDQVVTLLNQIAALLA